MMDLQEPVAFFPLSMILMMPLFSERVHLPLILVINLGGMFTRAYVIWRCCI